MRKLSGTDLEVSRTCFGTMTFGGQADEAMSVSMLDCCLENGINFIDTANVYTGGQSESIIGRWLGKNRDRVVLATKAGSKVGDGPDDAGLSKAAIKKAMEDSLRRLQTDRVDIYYFHTPDHVTPLAESLAAAADLVKEGKIRYLAASNYASWQVVQMLWLAEKENLPVVRITQPMYNMIARGIEQEFLPVCEAFDISTVVYNPLAGGVLTGKHTGGTPAGGTRFDGNPMYQSRFWHDVNFQAVADLRKVADAEGRSLVSLALGWLLHHTPVTCAILGASRLDQLESNLKTLDDGVLSDDALAACDSVWEQLRGLTPKYNR